MEYRVARIRAETACKSAKKLFEGKIANEAKSNPKIFYAYVRSKTTLKEVVGPLRDKNTGKLVTDYGEMCRTLNDFFTSVFTCEGGGEELPEVERNEYQESCCNIKVSTELIYKKLRKLKSGKAPGVDGIATKVLFECAEELCKPLFNIYEML